MSTSTETKKVAKGGEFLIKETSFADVYTRDEITEEQQMFAKTTRDFIDSRVTPNVVKIDKGDLALVVQLMHESAELGLLGAAIPEEYGGLGVDSHTCLLYTSN